MNTPHRSTATLRTNRPASQRGFTLVELMVVVIIIAISSALVIPLASRQMKDSQVHRVAKEVATTYRNSRMLALSRGGAVVVRWQKTGAGLLTVREGIFDNPDLSGTQTACRQLPAIACNRSTTTVWNDGQQGNQIVKTLSAPSGGNDPPITIDVTGVSLTDVCFTPMGRTMRRNSATQRFAPMGGPLVVNVHRGAAGSRFGLLRVVTVLPGGSSRLDTSVL